MGVFVSASADESCNLPMMEANAMGIPAVVFDCRGDYSDHCEYIKYGIVVNVQKRNKISKAEERRFVMAMEFMEHYHFCTRELRITTMIPLIPHTKFYDFPLSLAEWWEIVKNRKGMRLLTAKEWHIGAFNYLFKSEMR